MLSLPSESFNARAVVLAALMALAGCGGDDPPVERPEDFAVFFEHFDGTVPPPFHHEWSLRIEDGEASLAYVPDYSGEDVPTYRAEFAVADTALDDIYAEMHELGLLDEDLEDGESPAGGETDRATVTVEGERIEIPAYEDGLGAPLSPLVEDFRSLVPDDIWKSMERRADRYGETEYPDAGG